MEVRKISTDGKISASITKSLKWRMTKNEKIYKKGF